MTSNNNAKFAFYYLLSLVALVFVAISVGLIAFGIINKTIPDPTVNLYNINDKFKFAISALIIATPIFFLMTRLIRRGLNKKELLFDSGVRRWLTYFIILISSLIILGFLISVINSFLSGELTTRFILKALSVFVISGVVFAYYFNDIRQDDMAKNKAAARLFFIISLILVLAAFISVWFFIESPKVARERRLDQITLNNISSLESSINYYYSQNEKLPASLIDVFSSEEEVMRWEKEKGIEYRKISDNSFELCTYFRTDSEKITTDIYLGIPGNRNFKAGYSCLPGNLWEEPLRK